MRPGTPARPNASKQTSCGAAACVTDPNAALAPACAMPAARHGAVTSVRLRKPRSRRVPRHGTWRPAVPRHEPSHPSQGERWAVRGSVHHKRSAIANANWRGISRSSCPRSEVTSPSAVHRQPGDARRSTSAVRSDRQRRQSLGVVTVGHARQAGSKAASRDR